MSLPASDSGPTIVFQIGNAGEFSALIATATQLAFPGTTVTSVTTLPDDQALIPVSGGRALVILCDADATLLATVRGACDATGLGRWAVASFASDVTNADGEGLPLTSCDAATAARLLRTAWELHWLRRENAQLRGDLLTFGSRIAHDLRTPLGGVLTTAEMLQEILHEDAPANVPLIQPILDSTYGLVTLIERTSFFARAIAARPATAPLDMGTPFWNAYQQLESEMLKAQAAFTYPSTWPMVEGHEARLEAVWRILLTNAIQHRVPGTKIEAGCSAEPAGHRFWVRNECAVFPEKRASLYFPFHRLHEPGAPRGLGLSFMQRLVELDGGQCGVTQPAPGQVEFFFVLNSADSRGGVGLIS